ncbi:hypothetical protein [Gordonia insulae]|uniref:Uncharacterized protein n=1 Tax=Gordonia insulae TaxID=2420509 RepID=A0A3G8JU37_9ACTN|nr:hypothetical protein [Gordonia insulae]AZG48069.1 hypothetical protein D7316_04682 [Gordonia insulae]
MTRRGRNVLAALAVVASAMVWTAPTASAAPKTAPTMKASFLLQVPGGVLGKGGAAAYQPRVFYGHGHINPTPVGYGYIYRWFNASTGASGLITDRTPHRQAVRTGPGQLVVSGLWGDRRPGYIAAAPSVGTFYVGP